jgi:hypothetical protein
MSQTRSRKKNHLLCINIDAYIEEILNYSLTIITYITWKIDFYNEDNESNTMNRFFFQIEVICYEHFLFEYFFFQVFDAEFTYNLREYVRCEI